MSSKNTDGALILVLHDVEETRDIIEKLLQASGYRVDPARNEEEAVLRAVRRPPNLILVSLCDSETRVVSVAHRVRERSRLPHEVPIIIFCVATLPEGTEMRIGMNVYVTRPDNFDGLRSLLARLLRQLPSGRSGRASRQHRTIGHTRH